MTVISETATYDTLLMTTNAGALYTVHIPIAPGAKPVIKLIRSSGWAAYESLVVQGCGTRGGSLDHRRGPQHADRGYLYAMSKANGAATAITSYGKIPSVFNGVSHVLLTTHYSQLVGEYTSPRRSPGRRWCPGLCRARQLVTGSPAAVRKALTGIGPRCRMWGMSAQG